MRWFPPLDLGFCARDAESVARDLLGRLLVSRIGGRLAAGRIVETEAYLGPHDPASHASGGRRTPRNEAMYGPPGRAYVYFTYGMHWCFNVVTGDDGFPSAVLVRALEPVAGIEVMRRRRGRAGHLLLTSGPARLTQALGITRRHDGHRLDRPPLWLSAGRRVSATRITEAARVGITRAADWKLRFYITGNPFVSTR